MRVNFRNFLARTPAFLRAMLVLACFPLASSAQLAAGASLAYQVVSRIPISGTTRWDYLFMDSAAHRLYVSHGNQTEVIDTQSNTLIGTVPDTLGVHGIAIASDLGRGYTSNGKANAVTVFDLATLKPLGTIAVGQNPDAIVYVPQSHRVVTFNGRSNDLSVIDASSGQLLATVAVGGKPEFAQIGENGQVFFNVEDTHEMAVFDATTLRLIRRFSLRSCEEPTGLGVDLKLRLYSVCHNRTMVVSSPDGAQQFQAPIGNGPDGVVWMDGYAFSADGADASISVVAETGPGTFTRVATVPTEYGARTIAADPLTHRLYLPSADFEPNPAKGETHRAAVANSFHVLVLQAQ